MTGCLDTGRPGCCGMLCRSAHAALRRLPVDRYPVDVLGLPDTSARPERGWICALVSYRSERDDHLGVPGISGGQRPMHAVVAAGSFDEPLRSGGRVTVDARSWRVSGVCRGQFVTAELIPGEAADGTEL